MSKTSKHTPGPWEVERGYPRHGEYDYPVVQGFRTSCAQHGSDPETVEANARIMAAAPELLESLEQLLDWMQWHTGPKDGTLEILTTAAAVIKKATGKL